MLYYIAIKSYIIYTSNISISIIIIMFVWPKARCKRARILVALLANHHQPYLITYSKLARTLQYLAVICGQKSYRIRLMGPHLYIMPLQSTDLFRALQPEPAVAAAHVANAWWIDTPQSCI